MLCQPIEADVDVGRILAADAVATHLASLKALEQGTSKPLALHSDVLCKCYQKIYTRIALQKDELLVLRSTFHMLPVAPFSTEEV